MTTRRAGSDRAEQLLAASPEPHGAITSAADIATVFAGAPLFRGMPEREISRALAAFDEARFPSGRRVVLEGLQGSDFFLIIAGTAAVLVDGWRVAALGPGDFFGEVAILGDGQRTASVRAETSLHCLVLANGQLEALILDHPQLGINMLHAVIARHGAMRGRRQPPATEMVTG